MTAVLWSGAELFMRQGVQFVVAVILARLLSPEEFGTIALLYLFTGIASAFIDGGFSSALVQKQVVTHTDESTVFWINFAISLLVSLALWAMAPLIAEFFGYPILVPLTGMLAISLVVNALGSIHLVLFGKRLDFKKPMFVSVVAALISGTTAIVLAMNDFGIWALAWQTIVASLASTLMLWMVSPWRPALVFCVASARGMFRFGSYLMLSSLLDTAYNRSYSLLIGKFYGVSELALYNRADNTKQIPVDVLSSSLSRVAFPAFSEAAQDPDKLRRGVRSAVRVMMFVNLPMMFGLMATADNVIVVLFGEAWLQSAPILVTLCIAGVFWPLHVVNLNVLKALGRSNLFFRLEVIKKAIGVVLLLVGACFGSMGIALSQVVLGVLAFFINAHYTNKLLRYGAIRQVLDVYPVLLASLAMTLIVLYLGENAHYYLSIHVLLGLQILSGVVSFFTISFIFRMSAFSDIYSLIVKS